MCGDSCGKRDSPTRRWRVPGCALRGPRRSRLSSAHRCVATRPVQPGRERVGGGDGRCPVVEKDDPKQFYPATRGASPGSTPKRHPRRRAGRVRLALRRCRCRACRFRPATRSPDWRSSFARGAPRRRARPRSTSAGPRRCSARSPALVTHDAIDAEVQVRAVELEELAQQVLEPRLMFAHGSLRRRPALGRQAGRKVASEARDFGA